MKRFFFVTIWEKGWESKRSKCLTTSSNSFFTPCKFLQWVCFWYETKNGDHKIVIGKSKFSQQLSKNQPHQSGQWTVHIQTNENRTIRLKGVSWEPEDLLLIFLSEALLGWARREFVLDISGTESGERVLRSDAALHFKMSRQWRDGRISTQHQRPE